MKYIDADLLWKEIDNWKEAMSDAIGEYSDGVRFALEHFTFVLDSLQQEFEVEEFSFKGGTATINGEEHSFKPGKAKVIILDITENED